MMMKRCRLVHIRNVYFNCIVIEFVDIVNMIHNHFNFCLLCVCIFCFFYLGRIRLGLGSDFVYTHLYRLNLFLELFFVIDTI